MHWVKGSGIVGNYGIGHSCGSDSIPGLGTSICHGRGHKKMSLSNFNNHSDIPLISRNYSPHTRDKILTS